ncbi:hypothetical protein ACFW24_38370 [Streptomyces nigra]|uniref:hypothetical protein n=1 Tax=Streptomyces nigra TaxID=1827580 RepID=UPI003675C03F
MKELAGERVPVTVACRVLKLARQPYYRWLDQPVTDAVLEEAYRANTLFEAHRDDQEFGYRLLADEARGAGAVMADRTAWRICRDNRWWSVFGKKTRQGARKPARQSTTTWSAVPRNRPEPAMSRRHRRTRHRGREMAPLRGQGSLQQQDRGPTPWTAG